MSQEIIDLAVAGVGTAGSRHVSAINYCNRTKLVGVVDSNHAALCRFAEAGVECAQTVSELLSRVPAQGLIVATPTDQHKEPAMEGLKCGAAVLVEKPVSTTLEDAEEIELASQRYGIPVVVGHQRRFHTQVREAHHIIESGELGRLTLVSGIWGVRKHSNYYESQWRQLRDAGPVMINLTHDIDLLRFLCGEIDEIFAFVDNAIENLEKEDAVAVTIRFQSGALGVFAASDRVISPWGWEFATGENIICPQTAENCFRLAGTKGSLDFPNLILWKQETKDGDWTKPISPVSRVMTYEDPYLKQIEHFVDVIQGSVAPIVTVRDATENVAAVQAIFRSIDTGRPQKPNGRIYSSEGN